MFGRGTLRYAPRRVLKTMEERAFDANLTTAEVYRMAGVLLRKHGKDAVIVANMRAGELLIAGDMDGYRTWKRLVMLVDGMTDQESGLGMPLH